MEVRKGKKYYAIVFPCAIWRIELLLTAMFPGEILTVSNIDRNLSTLRFENWPLPEQYEEIREEQET